MGKLVHRHGNLDRGKNAVASLEIDFGGSPYLERPVQSGKDCVDDAGRNSFSRSVALKMGTVIAIKTVLRAYPKVTSSILANGRDIRIAEPFDVYAKAVALPVASSRAEAKQRKDEDEAP